MFLWILTVIYFAFRDIKKDFPSAAVRDGKCS